jgi:hypothetical protein
MTVKTDKFIVQRKTPCAGCRGKGWIKNPIYAKHAEWKNDFYKRNKFIPSRMEDLAWWADQGFKKGFPDDPEIPCPPCKGQGAVSEDMELEDALNALEQIGHCPANDPAKACVCGHHHVVEDSPQ